MLANLGWQPGRMTPPLTGLHIPLVTPFDADGRVDRRALQALGEHVLTEGAAGLVALGTTGEPATLSADEQDAVVACCRAACAARGTAPILTVGVGGADTAAVARAVARRGAQDGVDAILSVVPPYTRPATAGIVGHFERVAAASPVPVLAYDIPYRTGTRLGAAALLELANGGYLAGVKLSLSALDTDAYELLIHAPSGFAVLAGEDALIFGMAMAGAAGAIAASALVRTREAAALLAAAAAGDLATARVHAKALLPLQRALFAEPSPSVIKGVLHRQGLIATPAVRLPQVDASAAVVDAALAAARLFPAQPA